MRVHERGVGETRSCGTGICAAVVAAAPADGVGRRRHDLARRRPRRHAARSSGTPTATVELIGPAVLVAEIELDDAWLRGRAPDAPDVELNRWRGAVPPMD